MRVVAGEDGFTLLAHNAETDTLVVRQRKLFAPVIGAAAEIEDGSAEVCHRLIFQTEETPHLGGAHGVFPALAVLGAGAIDRHIQRLARNNLLDFIDIHVVGGQNVNVKIIFAGLGVRIDAGISLYLQPLGVGAGEDRQIISSAPEGRHRDGGGRILDGTDHGNGTGAVDGHRTRKGASVNACDFYFAHFGADPELNPQNGIHILEFDLIAGFDLADRYRFRSRIAGL